MYLVLYRLRDTRMFASSRERERVSRQQLTLVPTLNSVANAVIDRG